MTAIGRHRVWCHAGPRDRACDRRCERRYVWWHAGFELIDDNDPVTGIGDLAGIPELRRCREAAFANRARVNIVVTTLVVSYPRVSHQRDVDGLHDDLFDTIDDMGRIGEHKRELTVRSAGDLERA